MSRTELLDRLGTSPAGLSAAEAARRRARDGPNLLAARRSSGAGRLFLRQFTDPIVVLLIVAAALAVALGDVGDAGIILGSSR